MYPYSFDDANIVDTLFATTNLPKLSEAGIMQEEFRMLKADAIRIVLGDLWKTPGKYWEDYSELNISRLKTEVDTLIKSELEKNSRISFDEIIGFLLESGFMPLNIYAFLTGFLLKEYAADPYRYSAGIDGNFGGALSVQKLAEFISESFKQVSNPTRNYRPKYLEIMSANQRQFMLFASEIFNVEEDISIEQSAQKLRLKLGDLGWPLWCYVESAAEDYKSFLQLLAEIVNAKQTVSISSLAERAGQFLADNFIVFHDLKTFLTAQKGREIFIDFLQKFEGGIIFDLARKIGIENPVSECQRRIISGDGIWLRDKETAAEDLKKLILDYKIVAESRNFGIDGKSLNSCVKSWADYCRFNLKIPAELMSDQYPALKNFFAILKEILERNEIPQAKREIFLSQLTENSDDVWESFSAPLKILRNKFSYQLDGLKDEEIENLYISLPTVSFTDSIGRYRKNVYDFSKKIKSKQLKNELLNLWREVAGKDLPREWSKVHRTPIMAMVPQAEQKNAEKLFEAVMSNAPDEKDVQFAIDYLGKCPSYFAAIKFGEGVEEAFNEAIVEEYRDLMSNDDVRAELELKFSSDIFQWYPNLRVKELVQKFAERRYYTGETHDKVTARVMKMSASAAKKLLIELLDKNYEVGLKLLREP